MMHLAYIDNWRFKQFYNLEMYQILNQEVNENALKMVFTLMYLKHLKL